jgi:hypothetical protein
VGEIDQDGQALLNNAMTAMPLDVRNKAHAARVVLVPTVVKALGFGQAGMGHWGPPDSDAALHRTARTKRCPQVHFLSVRSLGTDWALEYPAAPHRFKGPVAMPAPERSRGGGFSARDVGLALAWRFDGLPIGCVVNDRLILDCF